jgi:type II secretory pathway pseudopilin PulG
MIMKQQGMTIIEIMGGLAIASILLVGLSRMIGDSLDDAKGQQAALYQAQVVNAANKYIAANYADLVGGTGGGSLATVTIAQLKAGGFLSDSFSGTNVFNQAACVLVRQPVSGKLDALVATYGGTAIPDRDIPLVAQLAGQGGGYVSTAAPGTARGASWQLVTTGYRNVACGGAAVLTGAAANDGGHLVSSLFYDGPGQLATDFLYRDAVPGRPELNQMQTPLHMLPGTGAQAVENDAGDPRCTPASGTGKIAVDASGRVLSCQAGVWKRQGSGSWKDPVAAYADLPASGNDVGDVRMVAGLNRAFGWTSAGWVALAVDQNGDLSVPGTLSANLVQVNQVVVQNAPCSDNGTIGRDATGITLSCQAGLWRSPRGTRLTNLAYQQGWTLVPGDGARDLTLDLASLPGTRPLYLTGYSTCHATGSAAAQVSLDMVDASGATIAYAGGCLSQLDSAGVGVQNLGDIGLQKIPENVTQLHFMMAPGAAPEDYITFIFSVYSE